MHRPHQVHRGDSSIVLENSGKMSDGAAQRPVAGDVCLFQPRLRVEGVQVLSAGWLAGERRQEEVRLQAVKGAEVIA